MNNIQLVVLILAALLIIAGIYIGYQEFQKYKIKTYQQGIIDGQIQMAVNQFRNGIVTFSNGTNIQTIEINKLCSGNEAPKP